MKYDEYKSKVIKVKKAKTIAFRFRFLILGIFVAVMAVSVVLFNTKGIITSEKKLTQNSFEYGQTFEYNASGFLVSDKDVHYEFATAGKDDWSEEQPIHPGSYQYRPYAYNNYKSKVYGSIQSFTITPKPATISIVSESVEYGETPNVECAELINGDKISSYDVTYKDYGMNDSPSISVDLSSLKIESTEGEDMTDCYSFENPSKAVNIKKRKIVMTMNSLSKMYDGTALTDDSERSATLSESTPLKDGDYIYRYPTSFVTLAEPKTEKEIEAINAGSYSNTVINNGNIIIKNKDDVDVTRYYNLLFTSGKFVITKRPLILDYKDITKVYDGTELSPEEPVINSATSLAETDELELTYNDTSLGYKTNKGTYKYTPTIKNKNTGEDVTSNYDITNNGGNWSITKRKISVSCDSTKDIFASDFRDGSTEILGLQYNLKKDEAQADLKDSLGEGDYFQGVTKIKKVGKDFSIDATNSSLRILHQLTDSLTEDVTSCYDFGVVDYSSIEIKKKDIQVTYMDVSKVYDGKKIVFSEPSVQGDLESDVEVQHDEFPSIVDACEKTELTSLNTRIELKSSNSDVSDYYNLTTKNPSYEITKRPITVSFYGNSKTYNGSNGINAKFGFTKLNEKKQTGLLTDHYIQIVDKNNPSKIYASTKNKEATSDGKYDIKTITLDQAGEIIFGNTIETTDSKSYSLEAIIYDANDNDVTKNYEITYNDNSSLTLNERNLEITFGDYLHYYDGAAFNPKEMTGYTISSQCDGLGENDVVEVVYKDASNTCTGDETLKTPAENVIEKQYDMNDYFTVKIKRSDTGSGSSTQDVTSSYHIDAYFGTLTIRRVQLVVESNKAIQADTISTFYGNTSTSNQTSLFQFSEESDYYPNDEDNVLSQSYTIDSEFSLTGDASPDKKIGETIAIQAKNYGLSLKNNTYEDYGYQDISINKIDFRFSNKSFSSIIIKRRTFQFSLKSTKFYLGNDYQFEPGSITEELSTSTDSTNYSPYNILIKTQKVDSDTRGDTGKGLASSDKLVFSWKDGVGPSREEGVYNLSDYLTWKITNNYDEDVTNCYMDENGQTLVAGDTSYYETATLEYKIPVIALQLNQIKVTKAYDGEPVFNADGTDENKKSIFSINSEYAGVDYPSGAQVSVQFKSDSLSAKAGTYNLTRDDITNISITVSSSTSYTYSINDTTNPLVVLGDVTIPTITITRKKDLSVSIDSYEKQQYDGPTGGKYNTDVYYDGKQWGLYVYDDEKKNENTHYLKLTVKGLLDNEKFILVQKQDALPSLASDDPYHWSDYYDYKIMKYREGEDPIDVTENYAFEDGKSLEDLDDFNIKKIRFGFSLNIKNEYEWYENDGEIKPTFTYKQDKTETSTDIHPTNFNDVCKVTFSSNQICSTTTIQDNIAVPQVTAIEYTYFVGNEKITLKWTPNDNSLMELDNRDEYSYYSVKKKKCSITLKNTKIEKVFLSANQKVNLEFDDIFKENLGQNDNYSLRAGDNLRFDDYALNVNSTGTYTINMSDIMSHVHIVDALNVDVTQNYDIEITNSSLEVVVSKPKLVITLTSKSIEYDGKNKTHALIKKPQLFGSDGKEMKNATVNINSITFNQSIYKAGTYSDFSGLSIASINAKVSLKDIGSYTMSKDDFSDIVINNKDTASFTITKSSYQITCKSFSIDKSRVSSSDIIQYLRKYIKDNKTFTIKNLGSKDALNDYNVTITYLGGDKYSFKITPTSIMHDGQEEVISCYDASKSDIRTGTITLLDSDDADIDDWFD